MSEKKSVYDAILTAPHDIELEKIVLGCFMLSNEAVTLHIDAIKTAEVFYFKQHQTIFNAIQELYRNNDPIDIVTVTSYLGKLGKLSAKGEDGLSPFYITEMTTRIGSTTNLHAYIKVLLEFYMKRKAIELSMRTVNEASDPTEDAFDVVQKLQKDTADIYDIIAENAEHVPSHLIVEFLGQVEKALNHEGTIIGVPAGIADLDAMTNGWQGSNLILVGARPAMGKTGFMLTLSKNAIALTRKPIAIFSLEMSALELMGRLIAMFTGTSSKDALAGNVPDDYFEKAQEYANVVYKNQQPLLIVDDTAGLNIFDIKARAKRYFEKYNIGMILLDYVQLAVRNTASQDQVKRELSIIGKGLKELSKELGIPVIALSQLNRDVEKTPTKRPELMHLRDSGTLEEDADMVLFLFRKEYYYNLTKKEEFKMIEIEGAEVDSEGIGEIIIAKYRNGAVGSVFCEYIPHTTEWKDMNNNGGGSGSISTIGRDYGANIHGNKNPNLDNGEKF